MTVDLQAILDLVFDRAGYDAYLDRSRSRSRSPVPRLDAEDETWARGVLAR